MLLSFLLQHRAEIVKIRDGLEEIAVCVTSDVRTSYMKSED
jgi:hypothetical protein